MAQTLNVPLSAEWRVTRQGDQSFLVGYAHGTICRLPITFDANELSVVVTDCFGAPTVIRASNTTELQERVSRTHEIVNVSQPIDGQPGASRSTPDGFEASDWECTVPARCATLGKHVTCRFLTRHAGEYVVLTLNVRPRVSDSLCYGMTKAASQVIYDAWPEGVEAYVTRDGEPVYAAGTCFGAAVDALCRGYPLDAVYMSPETDCEEARRWLESHGFVPGESRWNPALSHHFHCDGSLSPFAVCDCDGHLPPLADHVAAEMQAAVPTAGAAAPGGPADGEVHAGAQPLVALADGQAHLSTALSLAERLLARLPTVPDSFTIGVGCDYPLDGLVAGSPLADLFMMLPPPLALMVEERVSELLDGDDRRRRTTLVHVDVTGGTVTTRLNRPHVSEALRGTLALSYGASRYPIPAELPAEDYLRAVWARLATSTSPGDLRCYHRNLLVLGAASWDCADPDEQNDIMSLTASAAHLSNPWGLVVPPLPDSPGSTAWFVRCMMGGSGERVELAASALLRLLHGQLILARSTARGPYKPHASHVVERVVHIDDCAMVAWFHYQRIAVGDEAIAVVDAFGVDCLDELRYEATHDRAARSEHVVSESYYWGPTEFAFVSPLECCHVGHTAESGAAAIADLARQLRGGPRDTAVACLISHADANRLVPDLGQLEEYACHVGHHRGHALPCINSDWLIDDECDPELRETALRSVAYGPEEPRTLAEWCWRHWIGPADAEIQLLDGRFTHPSLEAGELAAFGDDSSDDCFASFGPSDDCFASFARHARAALASPACAYADDDALIRAARADDEVGNALFRRLMSDPRVDLARFADFATTYSGMINSGVTLDGTSITTAPGVAATADVVIVADGFCPGRTQVGDAFSGVTGLPAGQVVFAPRKVAYPDALAAVTYVNFVANAVRRRIGIAVPDIQNGTTLDHVKLFAPSVGGLPLTPDALNAYSTGHKLLEVPKVKALHVQTNAIAFDNRKCSNVYPIAAASVDGQTNPAASNGCVFPLATGTAAANAAAGELTQMCVGSAQPIGMSVQTSAGNASASFGQNVALNGPVAVASGASLVLFDSGVMDVSDSGSSRFGAGTVNSCFTGPGYLTVQASLDANSISNAGGISAFQAYASIVSIKSSGATYSLQTLAVVANPTGTVAGGQTTVGPLQVGAELRLPMFVSGRLARVVLYLVNSTVNTTTISNVQNYRVLIEWDPINNFIPESVVVVRGVPSSSVASSVISVATEVGGLAQPANAQLAPLRAAVVAPAVPSEAPSIAATYAQAVYNGMPTAWVDEQEPVDQTYHYSLGAHELTRRRRVELTGGAWGLGDVIGGVIGGVKGAIQGFTGTSAGSTSAPAVNYPKRRKSAGGRRAEDSTAFDAWITTVVQRDPRRPDDGSEVELAIGSYGSMPVFSLIGSSPRCTINTLSFDDSFLTGLFTYHRSESGDYVTRGHADGDAVSFPVTILRGDRILTADLASVRCQPCSAAREYRYTDPEHVVRVNSTADTADALYIAVQRVCAARGQAVPAVSEWTIDSDSGEPITGWSLGAAAEAAFAGCAVPFPVTGCATGPDSSLYIAPTVLAAKATVAPDLVYVSCTDTPVSGVRCVSPDEWTASVALRNCAQAADREAPRALAVSGPRASVGRVPGSARSAGRPALPRAGRLARMRAARAASSDQPPRSSADRAPPRISAAEPTLGRREAQRILSAVAADIASESGVTVRQFNTALNAAKRAASAAARR